MRVAIPLAAWAALHAAVLAAVAVLPGDSATAAPEAEPAKQAPATEAARAGERYWRPSELDVRPGLLVEPKPVAPKAAGDMPGRVIARVLISESGRAERVLIEKSEPPGLFDEAVADAFKRVRYRPGSLKGVRVKSQMRVEVTFHPVGAVSGRPARAAK